MRLLFERQKKGWIIIKVKIKLGTVNDAVLFSARCNEYKNYDIDYVFGKYTVDAKSLMGILSIGLDHECIVELHSNDEKLNTKFEKEMKLWIVKEKKGEQINED